MAVTRILFLDDQKYWTVCVSDLKSVNVTRICNMAIQKCCTVAQFQQTGAKIVRQSLRTGVGPGSDRGRTGAGFKGPFRLLSLTYCVKILLLLGTTINKYI